MEDTRKRQIIDAINKTGYVLEYEVSQVLEKHSWSIINNRYYIDETNNLQKEIDILAYKTAIHEGIRFFFTLMGLRVFEWVKP